ncbi:hypothetical protein AB0C77_06525 [Streptomyces sp. NPDC048629]|uniref:hypothetical protein n=1 Tax=Streptomyces sp. NPDC048629 TaxID=3154824 RepID=UPI0034234553
MATTDDYGQSVSIATLTDAPNAETLAKNIANAVVQRSVMRFASATARTAALTGTSAPVEGMTSWLQDINRISVYDGSSWIDIPQRQKAQATLTTAAGPTSSEILTGLSITMTTKASTTYILRATGLVRSTLVTDRIDLLIRRGTTTAGTQVGGAVHFTTVASTGESVTAVGSDTPGAGSTTWVVTLSGVGSGNCDLTATSSFPAVFTVEEM